MYPARSSRLLIFINLMFAGRYPILCKYRYRQGAADLCRQPASMRDRFELSMGAGWRDQVTHALVENVVRAYRVRCAAEAFTLSLIHISEATRQAEISYA